MVEPRIEGAGHYYSLPESNFNIFGRKYNYGEAKHIVRMLALAKDVTNKDSWRVVEHHAKRVTLKDGSPYGYDIARPASMYLRKNRNIPEFLKEILFLYYRLFYTLRWYQNPDISETERVQVKDFVDTWKTYIQDYINFLTDHLGELLHLRQKSYDVFDISTSKMLYKEIGTLYVGVYGGKEDRFVMRDEDEIFSVEAEATISEPWTVNPPPIDLSSISEVIQSVTQQLIESKEWDSEDGETLESIEKVMGSLTHIFKSFGVKNFFNSIDDFYKEIDERARKRGRSVADQANISLQGYLSNYRIIFKSDLPSYKSFLDEVNHIGEGISLKSRGGYVVLPHDVDKGQKYSITKKGESLKRLEWKRVYRVYDLPEGKIPIGKNGKPLEYSLDENGRFLIPNRFTVHTLNEDGKLIKEDSIQTKYLVGDTSIPKESVRGYKQKLEGLLEEFLGLKSTVEKYLAESKEDPSDLPEDKMISEVLDEGIISKDLEILLDWAGINYFKSPDETKEGFADALREAIDAEDLRKYFSGDSPYGPALRKMYNQHTLPVDSRDEEYIFHSSFERVRGIKSVLSVYHLIEDALKDNFAFFLREYEKIPGATESTAYKESVDLIGDYEQRSKRVVNPSYQESKRNLGNVFVEILKATPEKREEELKKILEAVEEKNKMQKKASINLPQSAKTALDTYGISFVYGDVAEDTALANKLKTLLPMDDIKEQWETLKDYMQAKISTKPEVSIDVIMVEGNVYDLYQSLLRFYNRKPTKPPVQLSDYLELSGVNNPCALFLVVSHTLGS